MTSLDYVKQTCASGYRELFVLYKKQSRSDLNCEMQNVRRIGNL
jgi:hypothetical protein